jgi:hypothetical protein
VCRALLYVSRSCADDAGLPEQSVDGLPLAVGHVWVGDPACGGSR